MTTKMTDAELIAKANELKDWSDVCDLEKLAESEDAKQKIHNRMMDLYRREERLAGCE